MKTKLTTKLICAFVFICGLDNTAHIYSTLSLLFRLDGNVVRVEKVDLYYRFVKLKNFSILA